MARRRFDPLTVFGVPLSGGVLGIPCLGEQRYVSSEHTKGYGDGTSFDHPLATIQAAVNAASARDVIFIAPGNYDEAVTLTGKDDLVLIGGGGRGNVAIAPSASNAIALTIEGTSANRAQDITLINVGCEGNGTGGGLYLKGNIRRVRAYQCKLEGGAFAAKVESTAAGSVGDVWLDDVELAWATDGLILKTSGGGDPVTNLALRRSLIHNITTDCVRGEGTYQTNIQVYDNVFDNSEAGTQPTQFIDLAVASTTGIVTRNSFATTVIASTKFAIASGVLWVGNFCEAEGPATGGGTSGRPD